MEERHPSAAFSDPGSPLRLRETAHKMRQLQPQRMADNQAAPVRRNPASRPVSNQEPPAKAGSHRPHASPLDRNPQLAGLPAAPEGRIEPDGRRRESARRCPQSGSGAGLPPARKNRRSPLCKFWRGDDASPSGLRHRGGRRETGIRSCALLLSGPPRFPLQPARRSMPGETGRHGDRRNPDIDRLACAERGGRDASGSFWSQSGARPEPVLLDQGEILRGRGETGSGGGRQPFFRRPRGQIPGPIPGPTLDYGQQRPLPSQDQTLRRAGGRRQPMRRRCKDDRRP
jgi:hypothetical protein